MCYASAAAWALLGCCQHWYQRWGHAADWPPSYAAPRLVLSQNKKELLSNWWNEGKLEASEEMGDLVSAAGERSRGVRRVLALVHRQGQ